MVRETLTSQFILSTVVIVDLICLLNTASLNGPCEGIK